MGLTFPQILLVALVILLFGGALLRLIFKVGYTFLWIALTALILVWGLALCASALH